MNISTTPTAWISRTDSKSGTLKAWPLVLSAILFGCGFESVSFGQDRPSPMAVQIHAPVHFMAPDGGNVVVPKDSYEVEKAEDWLRLVPHTKSRSEALLIEAERTTHEEDLQSPLAMSLHDEKDDTLHLALLLPDGKSLEALGTYSGVRPRGILKKLRKARSRLSTTAKLRRPRTRQKYIPAPRIRDHRHSHNQPVCLANVPASFNKIPAKVRKRQILYTTKKYLGARNTLLPKPAYMSGEQVKNAKLPTEHFQGIQRLHGKTRGRYFVITGGLKYGSPHRSQLIVFEMGSQSATDSWALPSYGHSYKKPSGKDRTVKVVDVDSRLWHAGGIQVIDNVVGIPIWGDAGDSQVRFYDLSNPRNPKPLPKMTLVRPRAKANAVALTKLPNGYYMAMVYDDKTLDFYHSKSKNIFDGFKKNFMQVKPNEVKNGWETGGGMPIAGKGAFQNINFLTQCDGTMYMVGMRNKSKIAPITTAADYAELYRVDWTGKNYHKKPKVKKIKRRQFYCYNQQCNFGAGAGMYVLNRHRLFLYGASHWLHDGNKRFNFNEYSY